MTLPMLRFLEKAGETPIQVLEFSRGESAEQTVRRRQNIVRVGANYLVNSAEAADIIARRGHASAAS